MGHTRKKSDVTPEQMRSALVTLMGARPKIYNGKHTKTCECYKCLQARLAEFQERVRSMGKATPKSREHTVPVRAHWRKTKGHLKSLPHFREMVRQIVAEILEAQKKG